MSEPFILFRVADTSYGLPARLVQQVEMVESITRVPNTPDYVQGLVYVRGQTVPVINLRRRFRLPDQALGLQTRLVITRLANRVVALLVDSAREFLVIADEQIQPPPEDLTGPGTQYLHSVVTLADRLVLLLNLDQLLAVDEQQALPAA